MTLAWFLNAMDGKWHAVPAGQDYGVALCGAIVIAPKAVSSRCPGGEAVCRYCRVKEVEQ